LLFDYLACQLDSVHCQYPFELNRWPLIQQLDAIIKHLTPKMTKWSNQYNHKCFQTCYQYTFRKVHNNLEKGKYLIQEFDKLTTKHKDQIYINVQGHFYAKAINVIEAMLENVIIIKTIHKMRKAIEDGIHTKTTDNKEKLKAKFCAFYGLTGRENQIRFFHAEGGQAAIACSFFLMAKIIFGKIDRARLKKAIYVENPYFEVWDFLKEQNIYTKTEIHHLTSKTEFMSPAEHDRYVLIRKKIEAVKPGYLKKNHRKKSSKLSNTKITKDQLTTLLSKMGKIDADQQALTYLDYLVSAKDIDEVEKADYVTLHAKHDLFDKQIILTDASPALTIYPEKDKLDIDLVQYFNMLAPDASIIVDVTNVYLFGEKLKALISEWKKSRNKYIILASSLLKHEQLGLDKYQAGRIIALCPDNLSQETVMVIDELANVSNESFNSLSHSYLNLLQDLLYPSSDLSSMDIDNEQSLAGKQGSQITNEFTFENVSYNITNNFDNLATAIIHAAKEPDMAADYQCVKAVCTGIEEFAKHPSLPKDAAAYAQDLYNSPQSEKIQKALANKNYFLLGISLCFKIDIIYMESNDGMTIATCTRFPEANPTFKRKPAIYLLKNQNAYCVCVVKPKS